MDQMHSLALILIMAALTAALRFLPFVMFSKGTPKTIVYLGNLLPNAIMAMLVVYCLRTVTWLSAPHGAPELIAIAAVALLHWRWGNVLVSIAGGTALYMVLVQGIFA